MHLHLKSNVLSHQLLFSPTQMEKSPVLCLLCPTLLLGTIVYVGSFCLSNTLNFSFFPTSFWGSHAQIPSVPSLCKPLLRLFLIAFERKSRQAREKKKCQTTSNTQWSILKNPIRKSNNNSCNCFFYHFLSTFLTSTYSNLFLWISSRISKMKKVQNRSCLIHTISEWNSQFRITVAS